MRIVRRLEEAGEAYRRTRTNRLTERTGMAADPTGLVTRIVEREL
jgi:hypothetical protein